MAKNTLIDSFIDSVRNGASDSAFDGLTEAPKTTPKKSKQSPIEPAAGEKYEPKFEDKYEVDKLRAQNRVRGRGKDANQNPAEKSRRTVGAEMTEEEIFRIDKAVYLLKMTKRDLIRTAVLEYLDAHNV